VSHGKALQSMRWRQFRAIPLEDRLHGSGWCRYGLSFPLHRPLGDKNPLVTSGLKSNSKKEDLCKQTFSECQPTRKKMPAESTESGNPANSSSTSLFSARRREETIGFALMMIASYPSQAQNSSINLVNAVTQKCLQPINNSTTLGAAIVPQPCDPKNTAQVWIQTGSSGTVHFINYNSKLCLDARGGAATGTPIQQWTCNSITNENWRINNSSNNPLISAVSGTSKYCLTDTGAQNGAATELYPCTGVVSEIWNRPAVPDPNQPPGGGCVQSKSHQCP
jgi:hypothetical protein